MSYERFKRRLVSDGVPRTARRLRVGPRAWERVRQECRMEVGGLVRYAQPFFAGLRVTQDESLDPWGFEYDVAA